MKNETLGLENKSHKRNRYNPSTDYHMCPLVLDSAINHSLKIEAEDKAIRWGTFLEKKMPQLGDLIESGKPTEKQIELIQSVVAYGDVFRFKLFQRDGRQILESDKLEIKQSTNQKTEHSETANKVYQSNKNDVTVKDGRQKDNRPDVYVEAYIIAKNTDGVKIGVVEVYVDQTQYAALIQSTFSIIGYGLPILCGLIYLITSAIFLWRDARIRKAEKEVRKLSQTDPLTGLLNRREFNKKLEARVEQKLGNGIGVMFIDVDNFKQVNDENGHEGGDEFLINIAKILSQNVRSTDLIARLGGDEFVVAICDVTAKKLLEIAENIRVAAHNPLNHKGKIISGRLSIGCHLENGNLSTMEILNAADLALYSAKKSGKDRVVEYHETLRNVANERREIENMVRGGIKNNRFSLKFQALTNPISHKAIGFEALLRLQDGEQGQISPFQFIPVAEEIGVIEEVGDWVLNEAIKTAETWPDKYFVSVNLSVRQFDSGTLVNRVENALKKHAFSASRLELEVTESLLIPNSKSVAKQLAQLAELGVSIAIDDFGTGYSNISNLGKYKFDKLKIDKSFLLDEANDEKSTKSLLESFIELGHKMDMSVTVEGVETIQHATMLKQIRCDLLQGFLFGLPLSADEVANTISLQTLSELPAQTTPAAQKGAA